MVKNHLDQGFNKKNGGPSNNGAAWVSLAAPQEAPSLRRPRDDQWALGVPWPVSGVGLFRLRGEGQVFFLVTYCKHETAYIFIYVYYSTVCRYCKVCIRYCRVYIYIYIRISFGLDLVVKSVRMFQRYVGLEFG